MLVEPVDVQVPEGQGVRLEKLLLVERERDWVWLRFEVVSRAMDWAGRMKR